MEPSKKPLPKKWEDNLEEFNPTTTPDKIRKQKADKYDEESWEELEDDAEWGDEDWGEDY